MYTQNTAILPPLRLGRMLLAGGCLLLAVPSVANYARHGWSGGHSGILSVSESRRTPRVPLPELSGRGSFTVRRFCRWSGFANCVALSSDLLTENGTKRA